jgi:predicted RNA-binding protein (virulence factor B family)
MATIGKRNKLPILRGSSPGIYLDGGSLGEILLPNRFVPPRVAPGDRLDVFIYRDSEDRLVATTETPRATVGEVASLKVVSIHPRVGAFLDWGLSKDLLLPFREQTAAVMVGREVLVRVYLDPKTQRIVASMRIDRGAPAKPAGLRAGQPVEFVLTEKTELGFKALVDASYSGLLYHEGIITPVKVGQKLQGFVRAVRPDGKVDLTLQEPGFRRVAPLAMRIVRALEKAGGRLDLDDDVSPEAIREAFDASKKAFKQALGTLYKARRIRFLKPGIELLDATAWSPGAEPAPYRKPTPTPGNPDGSTEFRPTGARKTPLAQRETAPISGALAKRI